MKAVPAAALWLGLAGLLPFAGGALAALGLLGDLAGPDFGLRVLSAYGAAILAFMGGCLWGFAAKAGRAEWKWLAFSVVPGLWAFSAAFSPAPLLSLMLGYVVLLALDTMFRLERIAPDWWMGLRLPLTAGVLICLGAGAMAG
ncbi:DUF3429 domain-containing protein [Halovulum dunhuangense]|uniref:DUF3429 domain-containing protein n=1 Tax=Halovulum dunhuangense TaxID=1505036 RepID=A0A849L5M8_9RHOB|nr:DUF3429 domain-containing protein [Halovulum dunhuangense]NNU81563.1 DUF3429 domain-containing protein [Halovulum dunhuangense]